MNIRFAAVSRLLSGALILLGASAAAEVLSSRCADGHFANLRALDLLLERLANPEFPKGR